MKRTAFSIGFVVYAALTADAHTVIFEAEAPYALGTNHIVVSNTEASGGKYITSIHNRQELPSSEEVSRYTFELNAGTYDLYARLHVGRGGHNDDSLFISNDSFEQYTSALTELNGLAGMQGLDGHQTTAPGFTWICLRKGYTMKTDGTGYLKVAPREDGLDLDTFAFVSQDTPLNQAGLGIIAQGHATLGFIQ